MSAQATPCEARPGVLPVAETRARFVARCNEGRTGRALPVLRQAETCRPSKQAFASRLKARAQAPTIHQSAPSRRARSATAVEAILARTQAGALRSAPCR